MFEYEAMTMKTKDNHFPFNHFSLCLLEVSNHSLYCLITVNSSICWEEQEKVLWPIQVYVCSAVPLCFDEVDLTLCPEQYRWFLSRRYDSLQ